MPDETKEVPEKAPMVCDGCGQPFGDVVWGYGSPWDVPKFYCDDCHKKAQDS